MLGMAGIHRSSTLQQNAKKMLEIARDGRDSPLKYTQAAPNSLKSSELARFLFSEKQDLVWNFLGFSRLSSIEHLHLAKLVIGYGH